VGEGFRIFLPEGYEDELCSGQWAVGMNRLLVQSNKSGFWALGVGENV